MPSGTPNSTPRFCARRWTGVGPCFAAGTWNAFASVWLDNKTAADTARELSVSLEAVYVAKSKVLKRLEEEVLELAEDFPVALGNR